MAACPDQVGSADAPADAEDAAPEPAELSVCPDSAEEDSDVKVVDVQAQAPVVSAVPPDLVSLPQDCPLPEASRHPDSLHSVVFHRMADCQAPDASAVACSGPAREPLCN